MVTLALLFALKGVGSRPFYRWLKRDYLHLFPNLPVRTRLFRLFNSHNHWTEQFMAETSVLGVIDTYGIELIHPRREGQSPKQIVWDYFKSRVGYTLALFNLLVLWNGLEPDETGFVALAIAEFSL